MILRDNSFVQIDFTEQGLYDLQQISNVPLYQLAEQNPGLFVLPYSIYKSNDLNPESTILSLRGKNYVETGNIVGYLKSGDTELHIKSRFSSDNNDFLLRYLVERTLNINLAKFDLSSGNNSFFDFLLQCLLPEFIKRSMAQGIYLEYVTIKHNDSKFRGSLDIARHIKENIPFRGCIAYNTRERVVDNNVNQLIRHAIELIHETFPEFYRHIMSDVNYSDCFKKIICSTGSYSRNERNHVLIRSERMKISPFYVSYIPLIRLCQAILKFKKIAYGENKNEISGILFDLSWMWEAYIWSLLKQYGFIHPDNKIQSGTFYLLEDNLWPCYPDFLRKDWVIDAKYKRYAEQNFAANKIQIGDRYQLISYAHRFQVNKAAYAVPVWQSGDKTVYEFGKLKGNTVGGKSVSISLFLIPISTEVNDYSKFKLVMDETTSLDGIFN